MRNAGDLGPSFPDGLFVCQDGLNQAPGANGNQDFKFVRLDAIALLYSAPPIDPEPTEPTQTATTTEPTQPDPTQPTDTAVTTEPTQPDPTQPTDTATTTGPTGCG